MTSSEKSSECTRTVSRSGVPRWFAWLLLVMVLIGTAGIAGVLLAASVDLAWNPTPETPSASVQGYKLYRGSLPCTDQGPLPFLRDVGKVTSYLDTTVPDTWRDACYEITAYNIKGESPRSERAGKSFAPSIERLGVPVLTVMAISPTEFDITWTALSDGAGGVAHIDVRLGKPGDHWGLMVSQSCSASPCRITGLQPETRYQVGAVAYRTEPTGNVFGDLSPSVERATLAEQVPPKPTGLQVVSSTAGEVVILASAKDCRRVATSTKGSTATTFKRTVTCVR